MKNIYRLLLSAVALLTFVPIAKALDDDPPYIEKNGLAYSKTIGRPNTEGEYTITLESFVTGSVHMENQSIPADIVLVLDVSASMGSDMYSYSYTARNSTSYSHRSYGNNSYYYLHTDGKYYQVERWNGGGGWTWDYYRLRFQVNGTWYYLSGNGVTTTEPTNVTNDNTTIWTGILYNQTATSQGSRLANLKTAVYSFIDAINENDRINPDTKEEREERLGNRIAIVAFSGPGNTTTTPTATNSIKVNTGWKELGNNKDIDDNTGYTSLRSTVNSLTANGGTQTHFGVQAGYNLVQNSGLGVEDPSTRKVRTVVVFTDGDPGQTINWTTDGSQTWTVANSAITYASQIKQLTNADAGITSTVYTVSIIEDPTPYVTVFLGKTSSNYSSNTTSMGRYNTWNSTNIWANGNGSSVSDKYAFATTDAKELENIFTSIAEASGGSDMDLSSASVAEVDVVSASFTLPEGTKEEQLARIEVFTAPCTGEEGGYLTFGTEYAVGTNPATYKKVVENEDGTETITYPYVDRDIRIDLKPSTTGGKLDQIEVTGFDFSGNFCGEDETSSTGYHGHKLIVKIPILMDKSAVGGPDVATNADGSGIYVNGVNILPFATPHVSLPVNLHINKQGLDEGESAKFTIQRKLKTDPEADSYWKSVSSVLVTRHKGQAADAPITKVIGMPSTDEDDNEFVYRIVEDDWSWSYNSWIVNTNRSDELITNPFIFSNSKKENIDTKVRHAESKATNTFKQGAAFPNGKGVGVNYDDSKDNGRTVITVSNNNSNEEEEEEEGDE